jgi:hypothetical protein
MKVEGRHMKVVEGYLRRSENMSIPYWGVHFRREEQVPHLRSFFFCKRGAHGTVCFQFGGPGEEGTCAISIALF